MRVPGDVREGLAQDRQQLRPDRVGDRRVDRTAGPDLGGVTDGSPSDPLKGISRFKRSLTENELEIGREMVTTIRPLRFMLYGALNRTYHFFISLYDHAT